MEQRLGRGELNVSLRTSKQPQQLRFGVLVCAASRGARRQCAQFRVGAAENGADVAVRGVGIDPRQYPHRLGFGESRRIASAEGAQGPHRPVSQLDQALGGTIAHGGPVIRQSPGELLCARFSPVQFQAARVIRGRGAGESHAPNAARRGAVADATGGTVMHIPTAGIDHQQRAIRVFEHVRRMEIRVVRPYEIFVAREKGRVAPLEPVANDFARVVLRGKKVTPHQFGESRPPIQRQSAQGHRRIERQRGQWFTRDNLRRALVRRVRIKAAFEQMNQRVAHAAVRQLKPVVGADDFARVQEGDFHKVFETAAENLGVSAIRAAAQERAAPALEQRAVPPPQAISVRLASC